MTLGNLHSRQAWAAASAARSSSAAELPASLWLGVPAVLLGTLYALAAFERRFYRHWFLTEDGVIENLTFALVAIAAVLAVTAAIRSRRLQAPLLQVWLFALALACVYFAGEEISWGQQWFHWSTPAWIAERNDQQETNLHNAMSLLDNVPRTLLMLWTMVGGIAIPLWSRVTGQRVWPEPWVPLFWPTIVCLPAALAALTTRLPELIYGSDEAIPRALDIGPGEVKELFYGLFLFLYLLSVTARLGRLPGGSRR